MAFDVFLWPFSNFGFNIRLRFLAFINVLLRFKFVLLLAIFP